MNITVLHFDSLGSTNNEAADQARRGADEGLCIIANEQTAGRGRHGRIWSSEPGSGLYFSIVLRPKIDVRFLPLLTLTAGVAVHDTIKDLGVAPDIKWVNDILVGDKKISGILAEATETPRGTAVIVGIGINLKRSAFPDDLAEIATSLETESGHFVDAETVSQKLTGFLNYFYEILCGHDGPAEILSAWRQRSTYFSGKIVRVTLADSVFDGVTDGLEETGALRVKLSDGSVTVVQAGDVERLRKI